MGVQRILDLDKIKRIAKFLAKGFGHGNMLGMPRDMPHDGRPANRSRTGQAHDDLEHGVDDQTASWEVKVGVLDNDIFVGHEEVLARIEKRQDVVGFAPRIHGGVVVITPLGNANNTGLPFDRGQQRRRVVNVTTIRLGLVRGISRSG